MIAGWIESALAVVGLVSLVFVLTGLGISVYDWIDDVRWQKKLAVQARTLQAVGTPSLDDPEAGVWSWYDGKRWHTERRDSK